MNLSLNYYQQHFSPLMHNNMDVNIAPGRTPAIEDSGTSIRG